MTAVDLKRTEPGYRARFGVFEVIELPPARYSMIDGHGDPNTAPAYADALATLYPVAYGLKFLSKRELGRDYVVPPLEALWWADDPAAFTSQRDKARWSWTVMIRVPDWVTDDHVEQVCRALADKARAGADKGRALPDSRPAPRLADVRVKVLAEGLCVQTLHVGPYDAQRPVLRALHEEFVPAHGLAMTGKHHEIYLSDARRTAPERLRTILRQPVARIGG